VLSLRRKIVEYQNIFHRTLITRNYRERFIIITKLIKSQWETIKFLIIISLIFYQQLLTTTPPDTFCFVIS